MGKLSIWQTRPALKSAGFVASPTFKPVGQLENWHYAKFAEGGKSGNIVVSVVPQNSAAGTSGQMCIKSITMLNGRQDANGRADSQQ
ncbi:hypothetical protein [Xanthomonas cassavae]|uniref:hypothetical protein n=1 Tax=Xanthomonas cassavae TaxID=56450 RepID=UPI001F20F882|nr:hypothetical protein [Xanthomonas cassavae]